MLLGFAVFHGESRVRTSRKSFKQMTIINVFRCVFVFLKEHHYSGIATHQTGYLKVEPPAAIFIMLKTIFEGYFPNMMP